MEELEGRMTEPGFWDDPDRAREITIEVNDLKGWVEPWAAARGRAGELTELAELLEMESEPDPSLRAELEQESERLEREIEKLELKNMLRGNDDHRDALVTIHPGAGGTESQDWAEMLMRMYTRWAEGHDYEVEVLNLMPGEEAGIKSVTVEIRGRFAYGYLKAEKGVHRLVRISPFDSQSRRHTSFASVFVYPVVEDEIEIDIQDKDLRVDTYRASGAGGQHVNKTSSAVRITHEPTGIVVACQQERSQHQNRAVAMKMLRAALYQRELDEREVERQKLESEKTEIGWGNQIRSYVFQPYTQVTDHRTELKVGDVQAVMNGDLDPLIEAYLKEFGAKVA
jgi:peptide chain release factor 2